MNRLAPIAARPYAWPYDGGWSMADTALLLVDFQAEPVAETAAEIVVAAIARLLERWRAAGGFVLHGRRGFDPIVGLPRVAASRNAARKRDRILPRGTPGWHHVAALTAAEGEPVIDHVGDNAFIATDLAVLLQQKKIAHLVIAGLRTEGAVHATMRAANDFGLEALLLEDGTATDLAGAHATIMSITRFGSGLFGTTAPIAALEAVLPSSG